MGGLKMSHLTFQKLLFLVDSVVKSHPGRIRLVSELEIENLLIKTPFSHSFIQSLTQPSGFTSGIVIVNHSLLTSHNSITQKLILFIERLKKLFKKNDGN